MEFGIDRMYVPGGCIYYVVRFAGDFTVVESFACYTTRERAQKDVDRLESDDSFLEECREVNKQLIAKGRIDELTGR